MKNALLLKCALIAVLGVLLWIPLVMIENTIQDRTGYRQEAVQTIAASSAGEQKLWGPMLTVVVEEEFDETVEGWTKVGAAVGTVRKTRQHPLPGRQSRRYIAALSGGRQKDALYLPPRGRA